jgi:hypothetical protein
VAVLLAVAGRYGYHRDELYFLAAGRHLAWGYPDQPPLVAAIARLTSALLPNSLVALRVPSALAAGGVVITTALLAAEFGARRGGQLLAAGVMAAAPLLLGAAHLLSTTTFVLLTWPLVLLLVVRALRSSPRLWLAAGAVAGVGLLDNVLTGFLLAALLVGLVIAGPRDILRSAWPWLGALIALVMWAPYLMWQARHGWPQLDLARSIAAGNSGTSQSRLAFVLTQPGLLGPFFAPVWVVGLIRLLRDPVLRRVRSLGIAYLTLAVVFVVTGGKGYYLGGFYPLLLGAGAAPAVEWLRRRGPKVRHALATAAFGLSAIPAAILVLPVVPVSALHRTPIADVNYDAGETVGWPAFADRLQQVSESVPADARMRTVILARNYGEAGAVDRYGPARGLPPAYSGHNGYWLWGPPPANADTVIAVRFSRAELEELFLDVRLGGHVDNGRQIDNDEQGAEIWVCRGLRRPWPVTWRMLKNYG